MVRTDLTRVLLQVPVWNSQFLDDYSEIRTFGTYVINDSNIYIVTMGQNSHYLFSPSVLLLE